MERVLFRLLTAILMVSVGLSCGDDPMVPIPEPDMEDLDMASDLAEPDAGPDVNLDMPPSIDPTNPGLERTPLQDGVSPDGIAEGGPAEAGTARVGRAGDHGFTGLWAHCRAGDFKLHNALIEVCIQAETTNRNEVFTGGMLVDAREVGSTADDILDVIMPRIAFNVLDAQQVRVIRDGTEGGPAVLRVTGRDVPIAYLLGVLGGRFLDTLDLDVTTEYRLYPDQRDVEIVTWLTNNNEVRKVAAPGDWLAIGDRSREFWSTSGTSEPTNTPFEYVATYGPGSSFGWTMGEATSRFPLPVSDAPYIIFDPGTESIPAGEEFVFRRWFAVGDGSVESVRHTLLGRLGYELDLEERTITLNPPVEGRRVEIWSEDNAVTMGITDASGAVSLLLEPGMYRAKVEPALGEAELDVSVDLATDATIDVATTVTLGLEITDPNGPGIALVKIQGGPANTALEVFPLPSGGIGRADIALVPGTYTVTISRGMEYEIDQQIIDVQADSTHQVTLEHTVPTDGWIGADFHQHMEPSTDSQINVKDRILDNIAEGVDFAVSTDHDVVTDLRPYLAELGLEDHLGTIPGMEVSPTIGHVNVYPAIQDKSKRGNGTIELAYIADGEVQIRGIPGIFEAARNMPNNPIIQLNHPRGSSSAFETARYEPTEDPRTFTHGEWSTDFDTLEIVNRVRATCDLMEDWSTFLNTGLRRTGLGNSDSHNLRGDPAGSLRNYLPIDVEKPGDITPEQVTTALREGRAMVAAYAFMNLGDDLPGDTVTVAASTARTFNVRVQTPSWSSATRLYVIVNGQVVESLDATNTNGFDFDEAIDVSVDEDSWVIFFAVGPKPTLGDYGNPTLAFSNPIFLDVGGDGWQAPADRLGSVPPVDLSAINNPSFCD